MVMARAPWRTEPRGARVLALAAGLAALLASCAREAAEPASGPAIAQAQEQEAAPPKLLELRADSSEPRALIESLLVAAHQTRRAQARSAQLSWNTVAELLQRLGGDSPYLAQLRAGCPRLEEVEAYGALRWTILGERELARAENGEERRKVLFVLSGYGLAFETPFPRGAPLRRALLLPLWVLRRVILPGPQHPVRPRITECVRGGARPRHWFLSADVQRTEKGWRITGDTIWIQGLLLVTDVA
ncbi:MAG: hypothetical protein IPN34_10115 [Planctomycetes bacterium]|nr:hypothetical protein [Planctomycetota bacterium]